MQTNNTCFFTGHREIPEDRYESIYNSVLYNIRELYREGITNFVCGGAVGFDTLAARAVLSLKKELDIKLFLCLPCEGQDKYFSEDQKAVYADILAACDGYEVLYPHYVRGCMHARNRRMADMSCACIAYCEKSTGGSAYTVKYAISKNLEIIFVK